MIRVIHGEIWSEDFTQLNDLIRDFQSCVRFCYNRFHKEPELKFNDVRRAAKARYPTLNTRQVSDAVVQGQSLKTRHKDSKIIFGGRKAWEDYKAGNITKEQWIKQRDKQIYLRDDKTQKGNLNARLIGDTLRLTVGTRQWATYKLFVSDKFRKQLQELIGSGIAYNVRLVKKDKQHFKISIDYQAETPETIIKLNNGVIGVDTNPDRIAVASVSQDGNLANRPIRTRTKQRDCIRGFEVQERFSPIPKEV